MPREQWGQCTCPTPAPGDPPSYTYLDVLRTLQCTSTGTSVQRRYYRTKVCASFAQHLQRRTQGLRGLYRDNLHQKRKPLQH